MKTGLAAAMAVTALAVRASAAQEVVLAGWAVPPGTTLSISGRFEWDAAAYDPGTGMTARMPSSGVDSVRVRVIEVDGAGARRIESVRLFDRGVNETYVGEVLIDRQPYESPSVGVEMTLSKEGGRWTAESDRVTPDEATALATNVDDPEYPVESVRVGDSWEPDTSVIMQIYGELDREYPNRLVVRLDSVGSFDGGPAAFISQSVDVRLLRSDHTFTMVMDAQIVRRLDQKLDVLTAWDGLARRESLVDGFVLEGRMRRGERLRVER